MFNHYLSHAMTMKIYVVIKRGGTQLVGTM